MAIILKDITPSMNNIVITAYTYSEEDIDKEIVEEGMARHTIGSLKELQKFYLQVQLVDKLKRIL